MLRNRLLSGHNVAGMARHSHQDHPWCVRVNGHSLGAGVLLDEWNVLTCAHVAGNENQQVEIQSTVCRPEWRTTARVCPGSWVYHARDTRRRDVALLRLDNPASCNGHARLWCAPLSGGRVRAYGYPQAERYGIPVDAELAGDGGRGGELGLLNRLRDDTPWIEPGFSGAGVMVLDGDHAGHVIGIIVADFHNDGARAAWMMPTETIRRHLPDIDPFVIGEPTTTLPGSSDGLQLSTAHLDPLHDALTKELRRLLTSGWAGTVVLPGTTGTGPEWLARLVSTADPATRASIPDSAVPDTEFAAADWDTALPFGAIDAACDARGKPIAEIKRYLAKRFGMSDGEPDLVPRLLRRQPPACIVIDGVDRAESPAALIREVLRPLAAGARSRGMRLVLGFDSDAPRALPYEVSLDFGPIARGSSRSVGAHDAEKHVRELADAEDAAARVNSENESRFREPPRLPRAYAPGLRVRLAVAGTPEPNAANPNPELAAIEKAAVTALGKVMSFLQRSRQLDLELEDLRYTLEVHRIRADRHWHAEDQPFGDLGDEAARALSDAPVDIAGARELVQRYAAQVYRHIDASHIDASHIEGGGEEDRG
jgi:hypothetical protein